MTGPLQDKVERLARVSRHQSHCAHDRWEWVANRRADADQLFAAEEAGISALYAMPAGAPMHRRGPQAS